MPGLEGAGSEAGPGSPGGDGLGTDRGQDPRTQKPGTEGPSPRSGPRVRPGRPLGGMGTRGQWGGTGTSWARERLVPWRKEQGLPQVGRGEGPGPAGRRGEDAQGGLWDAGHQHRVSEGRSTGSGGGGSWEHVVSPNFPIGFSERLKATWREPKLRWAERRDLTRMGE